MDRKPFTYEIDEQDNVFILRRKVDGIQGDIPDIRCRLRDTAKAYGEEWVQTRTKNANR